MSIDKQSLLNDLTSKFDNVIFKPEWEELCQYILNNYNVTKKD